MVHHDVFGLQVSVDDSFFVEVLKGEDHFGHVVLSFHFAKPLFLAEMCEEVTTIQAFHCKIQHFSGLKCKVDLHDERMVQLTHNSPF